VKKVLQGLTVTSLVLGGGFLFGFSEQASAAELKKPISSVQSLAGETILDDGIFAFPIEALDTVYYDIDSSMGDEVNFWLDNTVMNTDLKFKVYTPSGDILYPSKVYTSGAISYKLNVNLNSYEYGTYKVKIYSPSDTGGGEYGWKVRVF
jgi:hypothetical protein